MYKKIMVAIDGSPVGMLALKEAVKLARELKESVLHIVHLVDEKITDYDDFPLDRENLFYEMQKHGKEVLNEAVKIAKESNVDYQIFLVELTLNDGTIAHSILNEVKLHAADLLVLGTHGRHGFNRLFLGSVAEQVIRETPVPVLVVRDTEII